MKSRNTVRFANASLITFFLLSFASLKRVGADTTGPASIVSSSAVIQAPVSGGQCYVSGQANGTAPLQVWLRSVTRDNLLNNGVPLWTSINYSPNASGSPGTFYGYVRAAYGDLLEVKAQNWYYGQYHTDIEQIGYVPAAADSAPPEFTTSYISASGSLQVTVTAYYGIYDPSYPIEVTLYQDDNPSNKATVTFSSTSDYPKTVYIAMPTDKRARLHAVDNYGNGQSIFYIPAQLGTASANGSFQIEPEPAPSERTSNNPVGGVDVQLQNGSFLHNAELCKIRGRVLEIELLGTYRSRLSYDGSLGKNWDSILNSRIQVNPSTYDITWFPGNGRVELFDHESDSAPYWKSPPGLFARLTGVGANYTISTLDGLKYFYHNNYLKTIEDLNGNKIEFIRNATGRVFKIIDDLGRIYLLFYYHHNRLAEIVDYSGRSVLFEYNLYGNTTKIIDEAGYTRAFDYQVSSPRMMTRIFDRNNRAVLENTYHTSGSFVNRVASQKAPSGAQNAYTFDYTLGAAAGLVSVTDPNGTVRKYNYDNANGYLLTGLRVCSNGTLRAKASNYTWSETPNWVETKYTYDLLNYLPKRFWTEWCPSSGGECPGSAGVQKSPYTWFDYNSGTQTNSGVDPRSFATLRLKRRDLYADDTVRQYTSLRESWTYDPTYHKATGYWEERAWRNAPASMDNQDASTWTLDNTFKYVYIYDSLTGNLLQITKPNVSQPSMQTQIEENFAYNAHGQILSHTEPGTGADDPAVTTQFVYYTAGIQKGKLEKRWIDVPGTADPKETYFYDALGREITQGNGLGQFWNYTYDGLDRLQTEMTPSLTYLGVLTTTYVYNGEDLIERRHTNKDHAGAVPTNEPSEIRTRWEYDTISGFKTKEIRDVKKTIPSLPLTAETAFEPDALFNILRVKEQYKQGTYPEAYKTSEFLYDEFNRIVRRIDYLSNPAEPTPPGISNDAVTDTYYNEEGRVVKAKDPNGLIATHEYDGYGRHIVTHEPSGVHKATEYDDQGSVNPALNRPFVKTYSYVLNGATQVRVEQRDTFSDEINRPFLERIYYSLQPIPQYYEVKTWYYKSDRKWSEADQYGKGLFSLYTYDEAGRLKTHKTPGETTIENYTYNANNELTTVTTTEWNDQETDQGGVRGAMPPFVISYQYDPRGLNTQITQAGKTRRYFYDSHGRLRREVFSSINIETQTVYDLAGNTEEVWESIDSVPNWRKTRYTTDFLGRVLTKKTANPKEDATNPEVTTIFIRDDYGQGRLLTLELPAIGEVIDRHYYSYDLGGRILSESDPNVTEQEYIYDPSKGYLDYINVFPSTYPGTPPETFAGPWGYGAVDFVYDGLGGCSCSGGLQATTVITRAGGTNPTNGQELTRIVRTFDPLGRVLTDSTQVESEVATVSFSPTYTDPLNYAETVTYPSGKRATKRYDANSRISSVTSDIFTFEETVAQFRYQGQTKIVQRDHQSLAAPNSQAIRAKSGYDADGYGLLTSHVWSKRPSGGTFSEFADWSAGYDAGNRIVSKKLNESLGNPMQFSYARDLLGRLTRADYHTPNQNPPAGGQAADWSAQEYTWDTTGNCKQLTECYTDGSASEQCEGATGYKIIRNERGSVTQIQNSHVLGYYSDGSNLVAIRAVMGPQNRTLDSNGNTTSIALNYTVNDNPLTYCSQPCGCFDESASLSYSWNFKYDAWNRITSATKTVYGIDCLGTVSYTHSYTFTYDGLGRRVKTRIQTLDPGARSYSSFLAGSMDLSLLSTYDSNDRMLTHWTLQYLFGSEAMPFMMSASPAKVFMLDAEGNAGAIFATDGGQLEEEKSTTSCGDEHKTVSATHTVAFNVYGNSYGLTEEGFKLVEDSNCSPLLITDEGHMYDAEDKEDNVTSNYYDDHNARCKLAPLTEESTGIAGSEVPWKILKLKPYVHDKVKKNASKIITRQVVKANQHLKQCCIAIHDSAPVYMSNKRSEMRAANGTFVAAGSKAEDVEREDASWTSLLQGTKSTNGTVKAFYVSFIRKLPLGSQAGASNRDAGAVVIPIGTMLNSQGKEVFSSSGPLGSTLAHELAHVLGIGHYTGIQRDQNIMFSPNPEGGNIEILYSMVTKTRFSDKQCVDMRKDTRFLNEMP